MGTPHNPNDEREDAGSTQVWLVGGGIASLAAAVFLIKDAAVPPSHVHIFDLHSHPGGAVTSLGDASTGYVLHSGQQISYHDSSTEKLLSQVSSTEVGKTPWDKHKYRSTEEKYQARHLTRALVEGSSGPEKLDSQKLGLNLRDRLELIRVMLESEHALGRKMISDVFQADFFDTKFWMIWSTTYAFHPQHSVVEFRRYLRKFVQDIIHCDTLTGPDEMRYSQYESIIQPITRFLQNEGVDFRLKDRVVDILTYPSSDPTTVSEIKYLDCDGSEMLVTLDPTDFVFVTLGSVGSGTVLGTNSVAPNLSSAESPDSGWFLWYQLAEKSRKFGNPSNFCSSTSAALLETFTVTLKDPEFFDRITKLTNNKPGSQPVLSLPGSNWVLSLNIPCQPVFHGQPDTVQVFSGWALHPDREGNYVKKPMLQCSGSEIMKEILQHLKFPVTNILANSITIPCISPRVRSPLLVRSHDDRPLVIPHHTTNIAFLGQFVEIPDEPTLSMEYSVQGAQFAVNHLLGLKKEFPKPWKNHLVEFLDLLT
ncbi:oleate hydratase [Lipomyces tetrasporus]|uniref:Oleate hydratase n=1 Tax=Lipomyces tetrasporus TaxID=54092 RepID=A0AAD7VPJ0_9ASCO|nr:oleate hydratase [Lipomyces tetrasporus]KAJ8096489.1 oleate hydratase [Lipomyces tetrasporus]